MNFSVRNHFFTLFLEETNLTKVIDVFWPYFLLLLKHEQYGKLQSPKNGRGISTGSPLVVLLARWLCWWSFYSKNTDTHKPYKTQIHHNKLLPPITISMAVIIHHQSHWCSLHRWRWANTIANTTETCLY